MFFKRLEFNLLNLNNWNIKNFINNSILTHVFTFNLLILLIITTPGIILRSILFSLAFFFIAYWLISIFTYLFKKARYGTFTRIIQRFWKRALYLFWLLEIGLFCIYLFLTIISPQEVSYMLDNQALFFSYLNNFKTFFQTLLKPTFILLLINIILLAHKYNTYKNILFIVITFLLLTALFDDFIQFYSINQHYLNYNWSHISLETTSDAILKANNIGIWEQEITELKLRPYIHYLYVLVFLKLWHTLFIVYVFLAIENIRLYLNISSYNLLAANIQNFYFLLFFNFILKIGGIKMYLNYLGSFVYYWFFVNYSLYDFSYMYSLFNNSYILYFIYDLQI